MIFDFKVAPFDCADLSVFLPVDCALDVPSVAVLRPPSPAEADALGFCVLPSLAAAASLDAVDLLPTAAPRGGVA